MSVIKEIRKEAALGYIWIMSIAIITFYAIVSVLFGPVGEVIESIQVPDPRGIVYLLLVSYSFFLIIIFILTLKQSFYERFKEKKIILKLILIHVITIVTFPFLPSDIFFVLYYVAYVIWVIVSPIFLIHFSQRLSIKMSGNPPEKKYYYIWWVLFFITISATVVIVDLESLSPNQQVIFLAFPLLLIIVPVFGLIKKPKTDSKAPLTLFSFITFLIILYMWFRFVFSSVLDTGYNIIDMVFDIFLINYVFYSLVKNAQTLSERLPKSVYMDQILFLLIWSRISSLIMLMVAGDELSMEGMTVTQASYFFTLILLLILGTIIGIRWAIKGLKEEK
jgi:hypothetical protein